MKRDGVKTPTAISAMDPVDGFFAFMRERHAIYNLRQRGYTRPWTQDPILHKFKFTNIYRELDRTTIWFRENIRDRFDQSGDPVACMFSVAVFRWFNRMETGDVLFNRTDAFSRFYADRDTRHLKEALMDHIGPKGPFVTGAHMVYAVPGMPLVDGVLHSIQQFVTRKNDRQNADVTAEMMAAAPGDFTIEWTWDWFTRDFFGLGSFLAYELVTDMRHTHLLNQAPDIMTWANAGPGSTRGLNRVFGRPYSSRPPRPMLIQEMRDLLKMAQDGKWPNDEDFPPLEMRDVEHALCEFDKYMRTANGDGYPRGVYK